VAKRGPGLAIWMATAGGTGFFPIAPGTAGSLVGVVLVAAPAWLHLDRAATSAILAVVILSLFALGVWSAGKAEEFFGRVDPGPVVIDEVVGQMVTLLWVPHRSWKWLAGGFLLFRILDIVKPFPARRAERFPRGWGIMVDDVIAGAYGLALLNVFGLITR